MKEAVADTIVLALGNPLRGDDGVGMAVLEQLSAHCFDAVVALVDGGTAGLETALLLQGYRRAIVVDAADMACEAGQWRRFMLDAVQLPMDETLCDGTLHNAGLAEALALAQALDVCPPEVVIYGVQPAVIGWEPGLSAPVRAAIPAICAAIQTEL